jgi:hypothetical protein
MLACPKERQSFLNDFSGSNFFGDFSRMHGKQCLAHQTAFMIERMTGICSRTLPEPPSAGGILPEEDEEIRALTGLLLPVFREILG